jgi:hypothetical protein
VRGQRDRSLWPYSRFSRQEPLLFFQVAPRLYSRGLVDSVPDPLLLRKSGSAGNRTQTSGSVVLIWHVSVFESEWAQHEAGCLLPLVLSILLGAIHYIPSISGVLLAWVVKIPSSAYTPNSAHSTTTPWPESASELQWPSDRRLSARWLPTFAHKGCQVVSVMDPYGRILGFLDRSRYFSIK